MITVEEHETIRRMYYLEHQSGRQIAKALDISRQSVAKALQSEQVPTYSLRTTRSSSTTGSVQGQD